MIDALFEQVADELSRLTADNKAMREALQAADENVAAFMREPGAAVKVYECENSIERFRALSVVDEHTRQTIKSSGNVGQS